MLEHSAVLIQLLSSAIYGKHPDAVPEQTDWHALYEEAKAHQVHTLIYPLFEELPKEFRPDAAFLEAYKCEVLREAALQILHMAQMEKVFTAFMEAGIPIIALKGLIIREYYPYPELRTMGDADVLVHTSDLQKAHKVLISLGYRKGKVSERHITYLHTVHPEVELHEILTINEASESKKHFSDTVWNNAHYDYVGEVPVLVLSVEDQILHLLFHTIQHVMISGIGIRQICDLTLFLNAHLNDFAWEDILAEMRDYGWEKFAITIFILCHQLFKLPVPAFILKERSTDSLLYQQLFIEDILRSGVYGKRTKEREASRHILMYMKNNSSALSSDIPQNKAVRHQTDRLVHLLRFFFPGPDKLHYQYRYVRKYPLLLPFAWLHRAFYNLRQLSVLPFVYKKKFTVSYERRIKLLQWLQLR
ncbi:nucleotidyltransferase family protein [Anaerocolumna sp. AGMB13020]|uniref:nucleotidyltransferase domain-containing protein n=1 Tax=Anaerocolumna sp. AGMB13020 TaxID=3081750 RepID=UPI0029538835|nr:nucleotidyltransferase family protein [Anaerocolumna sp. AGMB13020]WOO38830.1 nucleotidyltransferase family protein [Anaerocolumna sp. AGMB13020]